MIKYLARVFSFALLLTGFSAFANEIKDVKVHPASFNPSIGQKIQISLNLTCTGLFTLEILDRDQYPIRTLVRNDRRLQGPKEFSWDGKSDEGAIVPDEAYSLHAVQKCGSNESIYFPASRPPKEVKVEFANYDSLNALLRYTLPAPSRVQIQAGAGPIDAKTMKPRGPVMKVPVNREPRVAGIVVEQWNGMAEADSAILIPNLPNFAFSVFAIELPENAMITTGNRKTTFAQWTLQRKENSKPSHQVLDSISDISPSLKAVLPDSHWNGMEGTWESTDEDKVRITATLEGLTAESFAKQSKDFEVYVDQESSMKIEPPTSPFTFKLPLKGIAPGVHIVTLNWRSKFGQIAVNSMRLRINSTAYSLKRK